MARSFFFGGGGVNYFGTYRGTVVATNDPLNLKRVRLKIPKLFGESWTKWSDPSAPTLIGTAPSTVTVPAVGTVVFVMFENGDTDYPVWLSG